METMNCQYGHCKNEISEEWDGEPKPYATYQLYWDGKPLKRWVNVCLAHCVQIEEKDNNDLERKYPNKNWRDDET